MHGVLTAAPLSRLLEEPEAPPAPDVGDEEPELVGWAAEERELEDGGPALFEAPALGEQASSGGLELEVDAQPELPVVNEAAIAEASAALSWEEPGGAPAPNAEPSAGVLPPAGSSDPLPSLAFLVLGLKPGERPPWATEEDDIVPFQPPKDCPVCPASAPRYGVSNEYKKAPKAWWCAQRYYMDALDQLARTHADKQYYFLADADTLVFPGALHTMLRLLEYEVLGQADDLYMGHGRDLSIGRFVMSGGGVLIRGRTLRRAAFGGTLRSCLREHVNGSWCWRHLDWVLADCMRRVNVKAQGNAAFQQFANRCACCRPPAVACHPFKDLEKQRTLGAEHQGYEVSRLSVAWASPCPDGAYLWAQSRQSICQRTSR